jgi:glycolate oxidase FAD binding subunit
MSDVAPSSAEDLAQALRQAASLKRTINVTGNGSKRLMGGPILPADVVISTKGLRRVLQYEPRDLTVSVEAGCPLADLQALLAKNGQMIALDPPYSASATIGGVIAANSSGPMRRAFGTARDLVIGMNFAMLDGQMIKTGGMVVKNVAGLDMGKLLIGSFGTLGVITSVNFRLHPLPLQTRTFLFSFPTLEAALDKRNAILKSVLQPIAIDLLSPDAAASFDQPGYVLFVRATGSPAVLQRYARELPGAEEIKGDWEKRFWDTIRNFTPDFLSRHSDGVVLRVSTPLSHLGLLLNSMQEAGPAASMSISRAASGITYFYLSSWQGISSLWRVAGQRGWSVVVDAASPEIRKNAELWRLPSSGPAQEAFVMMRRVKQMFDPDSLLNRMRLYGRI